MRQSFVWRNRPPSGNVIDRRGAGRGGKWGIGSLIALILCLFGIGIQDNQPNRMAAPHASFTEEERGRFASVILRDTEEVWGDLFRSMGREYQKPSLVLFTREIDSPCGYARSESGPFYCPADGRLYLDLDFYSEMETDFGIDGEFARAYVIAHEVGHHVQRLLGVSARSGSSVQIELQADFLAGVWAHHAQKRWKFLQEGDVDQALMMAEAIGDDALKNPRLTHGTSAQRVKWFRKGLQSGRISDGKISAIR